jgi:putative membrane-bound dehydrogenase-like protein
MRRAKHPGIDALFGNTARGVATAALWAMLWTAPALAQKTPEESIQTLTPAEGLEVKVFASEPMIVNPIAMDVDTYGRVWVTEGVNYRRNVSNPPDNKIKVLEDTDGDGVADKMTVFASDLNAAMGVCVAGGKIYVPESPNLWVYEDKDRDLVPDGSRVSLLKGFGGGNHDHGLHSQVFGPDHKLYMTMGDTSYDVTGPDGRHIAFKWGAMIRCEGDGTGLEDFAVNFRNPVELAVDSFGNVWCSDNDNDGLKSVRICWILEGGNYGWFGGPEMIRNPDGSFDPIHHWRADKPGFVPYTLITGFGSPCGMTFYEGNAFGPKFANQLIHCDSGPREVRLYSPKRTEGVGYSAGMENILTASDNYYRPIDPCVAPDGSLFVTDWYDGGVGGHAYNDPTRGRIYKVTPKGTKLSRKEKPGPYKTDEDALVALASPNHATTFLARERLLESGAAAIPALTKLVDGEDRNLKARALWLLDRIGGAGRDVVRKQLKSTDPAFRALAVRIVRRHGAESEADLLSMVTDKDGEVFKETLLGLGKITSQSATAAVIDAYKRYDGSDRYLLETLAIASRGREGDVFKAVVDAPGTKVDPRLVNIVRILKPEDATQFLSARLAQSDLSAESRTALLAALSAVSTPDAGKSLAEVLSTKAGNDVKLLVLDALRRNLSGSWSTLKKDAKVLAGVKVALVNYDLAPAALAVVTEAGLTDLAEAVNGLLTDAKAPAPVQIAAVGTASSLGLAGSGKSISKLVDSNDAGVREAALKGLILQRESVALGELLTQPKRDAALKQRIIDGMMQSSDGAVFVLRMLDTKKLDKALGERAVAAAVEHPDVNVRILFEKYIPESMRPKTLGQAFKAEDILALKGDLKRGEAVFLRSGAAACNKCHRVKGQGGDIGPDLSQVGRKFERAALLEAIMDPSKGMAPEYVPYVVETDEGKVFAGFLHEESAERVVLKTIENQLVSIPRDKIEEMVKQTKSLMPELILKNVTAQDAADLLDFMASLQETEVYASAFRVIGAFNYQRGKDFGLEEKAGEIDFAKTLQGVGKADLSWKTAETKIVNGVPQVSLRELAGKLKQPADRVIYYFAVNLQSNAEQAATLKVGSDDGIQVWVNGTKVHDNAVTRALAPGQDKVSVNLKAGKNLILLKLDQGDGDAGLILSAETRQNASFTLP